MFENPPCKCGVVRGIPFEEKANGRGKGEITIGVFKLLSLPFLYFKEKFGKEDRVWILLVYVHGMMNVF